MFLQLVETNQSQLKEICWKWKGIIKKIGAIRRNSNRDNYDNSLLGFSIIKEITRFYVSMNDVERVNSTKRKQ